MAFLKDNPFWRSILIVVIVVLGIAGIIIGLFACLNDPFNRFKNVNLVLYSSIEKTFNQWFIHVNIIQKKNRKAIPYFLSIFRIPRKEIPRVYLYQ